MFHSSQLKAYSSQVDICDISPPLVYTVTVAFQAPVSTDSMLPSDSSTSPPNPGRNHNIIHEPGVLPAAFIPSPISCFKQKMIVTHISKWFRCLYCSQLTPSWWGFPPTYYTCGSRDTRESSYAWTLQSVTTGIT